MDVIWLKRNVAVLHSDSVMGKVVRNVLKCAHPHIKTWNGGFLKFYYPGMLKWGYKTRPKPNGHYVGQQQIFLGPGGHLSSMM